MRKWILLILLAIGLTALSTSVAFADNGPHVGDFSSTTDACAGCHRAHRGQAPKLLKENSQEALCLSCHGTSAAGAYTNVEDGVYDAGGTEGTEGAGLRGGGFVNVKMDPDMDGSIVSAAVTSKHNVGTAGTVWGNGAIGSGAGKTITLQCGSCHNPHGFSGADYYRILRPKPKDSGASGNVTVPDETSKNYTVSYDASGYRNTGYLTQTISDWCAQCHTRYLASDEGDSGDAIFKYRHETADNSRKCLVCHVAHGTSATMGAYSGSVEWPDGTAGGGSTDSRLLHVDNRGVCVQCHPSP
ncbi:MAG: cytochrome c3 family protein [Chloroflexi bacterium]|nr:cytochrome c3 family protein [Chloroflexota bacterium]